ncbi:cardiolipin synthase ClsB [Pseudomonas sp. DTU_2021_1001937_2_SI_NGA_ILE_001]|uniref:cardiolipin synthase ClsB n=1 Tax=Pseudomonas sp. DTU_2021_1001937_2_SI_NGA_ILE_001 TaxID=3077589 RepID=UPI0028FC1E89|nr:cardiolipin synthase ClsB [Pseudomonas sp. DTU_2021_1001937_2_SI_NGA_ILE_001]WNW10895.1 cardiolipin synthase ClsB [Pseudomonas sp. DTU_2021_1001937_2_SI_NGA_ILE_001]
MTQGIWRDGNSVELLINGEDFYAAVFEAIRSARRQVLIETFIIFEDRIGEGLQQAVIEAAGNGAQVVVTVDDYGTCDLSSVFVKQMIDAGVQIQLFDPQPRFMGMRTNLFRRLHRKVVVIDGEQAFIGGINYSVDHMTDTGLTAKQDYAVRVRGPIIADIHHSALHMLSPAVRRRLEPVPLRLEHAGSARMLLAERDNQQHTTDIEEQYLAAIRKANTRITLANAYFFPSYRFLRELRNASRRGVKVTLILQGKPDMPFVRVCSRLTYTYLLRDGVVIHEYKQRALHGKVALIDHEWSTVGSSNLDPLSLALNLEANLFIRDARLNQHLQEHLLGLAAAHSVPITLKGAARGQWWRAPMIFLCFHFLRHFPAIAGLFPVHGMRLKPLRAKDVMPEARVIKDQQQAAAELSNQEKTS